MMKKSATIFAFFLILFFTACRNNSTAQEIHSLSPQEFHDAIIGKKNAQLVDVCSPEEFKEGHLKNALNINYIETNFITEAEKLDLKQPIYIYCQSGKRSARAALVLKDVGFKQIYQLEGGLQNWKREGLQVEN